MWKLPEQIELSRQHLNQIRPQQARMPDDAASRMVVATGHDSFRKKWNTWSGNSPNARTGLNRVVSSQHFLPTVLKANLVTLAAWRRPTPAFAQTPAPNHFSVAAPAVRSDDRKHDESPSPQTRHCVAGHGGSLAPLPGIDWCPSKPEIECANPFPLKSVS